MIQVKITNSWKTDDTLAGYINNKEIMLELLGFLLIRLKVVVVYSCIQPTEKSP
jgi:hypothetical protein